MTSGATMRLRVKALCPTRRRAGIAFSREAVLLTRDDLGSTDLEVAEKYLAIAEDPLLTSVFIDSEGAEIAIDADMLDQLRATIADVKARETELQPASGVESEAGADASAPADLSISGDGSADSDTSQSLPGTGTSSAGEPGQPREEANASNGAAASDAGEGNQPGETSQPPAAEPNAASEKGPDAVPAAGKSAGKAKPKGATQTRAE